MSNRIKEAIGGWMLRTGAKIMLSTKYENIDAQVNGNSIGTIVSTKTKRRK